MFFSGELPALHGQQFEWPLRSGRVSGVEYVVRMKRAAVALSICFMLAAALQPAGVTVQAGRLQSPYSTWLPFVSKPLSTNPFHTGEGTYYAATGDGNCMFGPSPGDLMVAAMNDPDYNHAAVCGEYVRVSGPAGTVTVRIVDRCPECKSGDLDLSPQAFARIAALVQGRVPITWQVVSGDVSGPIAYRFKEGSSQWWTAVQVRNHRNPVERLEYLSGSQWISVPRQDYNYFVQAGGMGPGPYTFRVTDAYGNVLIDSGIALVVGGIVNGSSQFPPGP
jgi:expansin